MPKAKVTDYPLYRELFRNVTTEIAVGECSVSYLFSTCPAKHIKRVIPHATIIIVSRHPVDRAYSHYLMDIYFGLPCYPSLREEFGRTHGFRTEFPLIARGLYYEQLRRFLEAFPSAQVKIFLYEEMQNDLLAFLKAIYAFLAVDDKFRPRSLERHRVATVPRFRRLHLVLHKLGLAQGFGRIAPPQAREAVSRLYYFGSGPKLPATERSALTKIFEADIRKLAALIDRDLSGWLPWADRYSS